MESAGIIINHNLLGVFLRGFDGILIFGITDFG